MKYKHLSQAERYQIYALMKAGHDQTQIAKFLDRHKSTISRELIRNTGSRGYRPKQACEFSAERAQNSRNAPTVEPWVREEACSLVRMQWGLFASWERGSNENLNDLLRQYIPKKRAMSTVSDDEVKTIKTD